MGGRIHDPLSGTAIWNGQVCRVGLAAILERDVDLKGFILGRLAENWSPEQISGWLRRGLEIGLRAVRAEMIYAFFFRGPQ